MNYRLACVFLSCFTRKKKKKKIKITLCVVLNELGANVYLTPAMNETVNSSAAQKTKAIHFHNFAGYQSVREQVLETIILPLQHSTVFQEVAQATRGSAASNQARAVLFQGPAGVGKTTMARLIAEQSRIPMIYVPVENILSKYYGESAQNLAGIFDAAAAYEHALIFVDEIDALATSREQGLFEATRRLLSVLLRKIDGLESKAGVLTIGATNRTSDLDTALLSRFDTVIHFALPNVSERAMIFRTYARHLQRPDLEKLARGTKGLAGRNIEDICEYTERRWARQLIAESKAACAPPAALYLEVAQTLTLRWQESL